MIDLSFEQRYSAFCEEATELIFQAGLDRSNQKPLITGRAFYEACVKLSSIYFPEDDEINAIGPRGLIWGMYRAVKASSINKKDPDPVAGARSIALVIEFIIKHRPPLHRDAIQALHVRNIAFEKRYESFCDDAIALLQQSGLDEPRKKPEITGAAFYEACTSLAAIHFPDDKEVLGQGPRGLLCDTHSAVFASNINHKDPDPVEGARGIAFVLKQIIRRRPPLEIDTPSMDKPIDRKDESRTAEQKRTKSQKPQKTIPSSEALPTPYEGDDPYLFISYKREDMPSIAPHLTRLSKWSYNIWYDKGIPGGSEWDAMIEHKVSQCQLLLVFLSQQAADSKWVRREIKFADSKEKPILVVRLGDVALRHGLSITLSQYQMILESASDFSEELRRAIEYVRLL